ncbi:hypothetical protein [uncultured Methanobrevibacter sp.]|nr:hypothetical protein [uncultured Methanobrevibacter sp.]
MRIYSNLTNQEFMQMINELKASQERCYFGKPKQCDNCGECPN